MNIICKHCKKSIPVDSIIFNSWYMDDDVEVFYSEKHDEISVYLDDTDKYGYRDERIDSIVALNKGDFECPKCENTLYWVEPSKYEILSVKLDKLK